MKKFMVLYYAPVSATEQMKNKEPEKAKKGMEMWEEWGKSCGDSLVEFGMPLDNGMRVTKDGSEMSKNTIVGFSKLHAESMEAAVKLVEKHPHFMGGDGFEIDVLEGMSMPGME